MEEKPKRKDNPAPSDSSRPGSLTWRCSICKERIDVFEIAAHNLKYHRKQFQKYREKQFQPKPKTDLPGTSAQERAVAESAQLGRHVFHYLYGEGTVQGWQNGRFVVKFKDKTKALDWADHKRLLVRKAPTGFRILYTGRSIK